jgi:hypothetical protein
VISVVAGARNHLQANRPLGFCFEIPIQTVPTACSPNVPAPVRSLPLRPYTHTWPADVPCALRVLPEEFDAPGAAGV